ncbi:MAG: alpha-rhamnosidase [Rikenellaceae bacterium]|nr:alpha-rhamnosidase [Rikenellaceae bacterium]
MNKHAKEPTSIWYPGDYEIWLGNQMNNRRTERGTFFPPFWKTDNHYPMVEFSKKFSLNEPEEIEIAVEGRYNVKLNGVFQFGEPRKMVIPAGEQHLKIKVFNQATPPALFLRGKTVFTDSTWLATSEDKEWIDESGKVSDASATTYVPAGSWHFRNAGQKPSEFRLATEPQQPVSVERLGGGTLVDFGRETFGYPVIHGLQGKGQFKLYYGESVEEALSEEWCETLDFLDIDQPEKADRTLTQSQAYRWIFVKNDSGVHYDSISMLYEYLPLEYRGEFRCNDSQINKIWDVAAYTMHLTTREFFIDGIKRDRWVWSGDATQSYLLNYYLFFDTPSVERTMALLRGKDPVSSHINTIMDYTFYWFISVYDYYLYTGEKRFIELYYPRMVSLMDWVLGRRNENGMVEGLAGDWVFIDWADGYLDKRGEVSFEQLLLCRSLEAMALCAEVYGDHEMVPEYRNMARILKGKLFDYFWDKEKQVFVHNRIDGVPSETVTRYTNMFAIFFDYLTQEQKESVKKNVLLNDRVLQITTPYMRFYELEALCATGDFDYVMREIKSYWGGMLELGATSFWEKYDPQETGAEHWAMYAKPYRKSLCHAWGASPIYLLGKYFAGVKPTSPGYETYTVEPVLGGLKWLDATVPTPKGDIKLYVSENQLKVKSDTGVGTLRFYSLTKPVIKGIEFKELGNNRFEMSIQPNVQYDIEIQMP